MKLNPKEASFRTNLFLKFRDNPDVLKKYGIEKCEKCRGSGLSGSFALSDGRGHTWEGEFCDICQGIGYGPIEDINEVVTEIFAEFKCSRCNGEGCFKCNSKGFVDWIEHACGG